MTFPTCYTPCSVKFSRKQISRLMIGYFSKNTFLISCQRDIYDATFTGAQRYFKYSAMPSLLMAFQASSSNIILRIPFSFLILLMNVSIMIMVTIGKSTLLCRLSTQRLFHITMEGFQVLAPEPDLHLSAYPALH